MPENKLFLDANILLRHLTQDHKVLSKQATTILKKTARGEITSYISTLVLHEVVYVLIYVYNADKKDVVANIKKLVGMKNVDTIDLDKTYVIQALNDFEKYKVDFPDCIYKQFALRNSLKIASFDRDFKILGVTVSSK